MQTVPAGGTPQDVRGLIQQAEARLAKLGYPATPFGEWTWRRPQNDDAWSGAKHTDDGSDVWVFGGYPEFARLGVVEPDAFVEINRARFPADSCVVELDGDTVRLMGAKGWLAFHLELPGPAADEADAAVVRALNHALGATGKILDPEALPRDVFGVHRPVAITISLVRHQHAVRVETPPSEHGWWPNRAQPLEPHERATRALGALVQDPDSGAAREALWTELVEALRWFRHPGRR